MVSNDEANFAWLFPRQMPGSGQSLRTRAIIAVIALIMGPTLLCGYLNQRQAARALESNLTQNSQLLASTAANLIAAHYAGDASASPALQSALDETMSDRRIAFFVVTDTTGRTLDARYNEPVAYDVYRRELTPSDRISPVTLNRSITLPGSDDTILVVRRQLIRTRSADAGPASPIGYLELGLHDPTQVQVFSDLRDTSTIIVATLCLITVPLAVLWVNHWMSPLRQMLATTLRVVMGGPFSAIKTNRRDEIGLLARSFNTMASNLTMVQNALVESNELLERKVADRTEELDRANHRLRREMQDKDEFLRAVTHDLGAPLRNIAGLAQRLLIKHSDQMDEAILDKLERIAANARAENELINDLLELSRLGRHRGRPTWVDLNHVVEAIGEHLSCDLEDGRIELVIDRPMPSVYIERNRIRQLLQNLIDNAIKHVPAGTAPHRIHVGWKLIDNQRVAYVRDTGVGIDPKDHKTVFQVFQRARYSGPNNSEGRGVGLASVKAIVECYGGSVWVESELGKGATFYFTLPDDPAAAPDPTAKPGQAISV